MYSDKIVINVNRLIAEGVLIESHFILDCLLNSNKELINTYILKCGKISLHAINQLINKGYIEDINNEEKITFDKLKITKKGFEYLEKEVVNNDLFFEEFKSIFPKKTPKGRRLHLDQDACRKKYNLIANSKELHETILKCLQLEINDRTKTLNLEFMNAMPVWLNQKNYKVYLEESLEIKNNNIGKEEDYDTI